MLRFWVMVLALVVAKLTVIGAMAAANADQKATVIQFEMEAGLLTLVAENARLREILIQIGAMANFEIVLTEDYVEPPPISMTLDGKPIGEAIEHLMRGTNRIIFYAPVEEGTQILSVSQIWLLGPSEEGNGDELRDEEHLVVEGTLFQEDGKSRSEAVLRLSNQTASDTSKGTDKERVLVRLTEVLQADRDALVRARAAVALGALGDQRAVSALEGAMLDEHPTVRSQVINALGQIGGERAIEILGNVLLYGSTDKIERIMAAQSLWKQDSEIAKQYLRTGTYDADEQVRLASSKAPSSSVRRTATEQSALEETQ